MDKGKGKKRRKLQEKRKETKRRENVPCRGICTSPVCHGQRANFPPHSVLYGSF